MSQAKVTYLRNPDIIAADMDGEKVMLSIDLGQYFGVGGVGSRVWELLAEPMTLEQVANVIGSEYEIDEATCRADMAKFIETLAEHGLVSME